MLMTSRDHVGEVHELRLKVRADLSRLHDEFPRRSPPGLSRHVRDVVVLASSSRGGSSMLAEILRSVRGLLHFRAEINPFLWLNGLAYPLSGTGSDRLELRPAEHGTRLIDLDRDLGWDCGRPSRSLTSPEEVDCFAHDLSCRLTLQWPLRTFHWRRVRRWLGDALRRLQSKHGWSPGAFGDTQLFHAVFLCRARVDEPTINPYYYDLRPSLIRDVCPDAPVPDGPPGPAVVEEPPFITAGPWESARVEDLVSRPLVIKTPSNAYRLEALQKLFPGARLRVLHLTRNAAATINGLYDGWCYRGFFAHCMGRKLEIQGYSDRFPEWGPHWWKFDLPPGWPEWRHRRLEEVCAFQWQAAHRAVLEFLERHSAVPFHRLGFESVVGEKDERREAFRKLLGWLGVDMETPFVSLLDRGLPPIMATDQPRHRRWYRRAALLGPVLARKETCELMERLGYEQHPATWL